MVKKANDGLDDVKDDIVIACGRMLRQHAN